MDRKALFSKKEEHQWEYPDILAESKAEAYAELRIKLTMEMWTRPLSPVEVARQILTIKEAAFFLADKLRRLKDEAITAINAAPGEWSDPFMPDPFKMRRPTLADIQRMAEFLEEKAAVANSMEVKEGRRGKAPSKVMREIAMLAANDFFEITGKEPSRSTNAREFPEFLELLFEALEIEAKYITFVQATVEGWRRRRE